MNGEDAWREQAGPRAILATSRDLDLDEPTPKPGQR